MMRIPLSGGGHVQAYAAPQLNADRNFDDSTYGFGSGVFFVGYMVFQIPSQLVAEKVGLAR